jgi:hypothetical protein
LFHAQSLAALDALEVAPPAVVIGYGFANEPFFMLAEDAYETQKEGSSVFAAREAATLAKSPRGCSSACLSVIGELIVRDISSWSFE